MTAAAAVVVGGVEGVDGVEGENAAFNWPSFPLQPTPPSHKRENVY